MELTIKIDTKSKQAKAFLEYVKTLSFAKIEKKEEPILEEDEYGIPIAYKKEIMAISKAINKAGAKKWSNHLNIPYIEH